MPVYMYKNLATEETFEIVQRISDPALTKHPETGDPVKRRIQPVGIAFKGSGFYVNDSRSTSTTANSAGEAKASEEPKVSSSAEDSTKSEGVSKHSESKGSDS